MCGDEWASSTFHIIVYKVIHMLIALFVSAASKEENLTLFKKSGLDSTEEANEITLYLNCFNSVEECLLTSNKGTTSPETDDLALGLPLP